MGVSDRVPWSVGSALRGRKREFYVLWFLAALAYGAGDILTTLPILVGDVGIAEGNVVMASVFTAFGPAGIVGLKLLVIVAGVAMSVSAIDGGEGPLMYYGPPLFLAVLGGVLTMNNLVLLVVS